MMIISCDRRNNSHQTLMRIAISQHFGISYTYISFYISSFNTENTQPAAIIMSSRLFLSSSLVPHFHHHHPPTPLKIKLPFSSKIKTGRKRKKKEEREAFSFRSWRHGFTQEEETQPYPTLSFLVCFEWRVFFFFFFSTLWCYFLLFSRGIEALWSDCLLDQANLN